MYNGGFDLTDPFSVVLVAKSLSDGHIFTQTFGALPAQQVSINVVSGVLNVMVFGRTVVSTIVDGSSFVLSVEDNNWVVRVTLNGQIIANYVYAGDTLESGSKLVLGGYGLANGTVVSDWTGHLGYFGIYQGIPDQQMVKRDVRRLVETWISAL